jgi:hypothetical protein
MRAWNTFVAGWRRAAAAPRFALDQGCQLGRRLHRPVSDNEPGDAPALLFFAVTEEDVGQFFRAQIVNQVGGCCPVAGVEPHIERAVVREREAARGVAQLARRQPQVEQNTVDGVEAVSRRPPRPCCRSC